MDYSRLKLNQVAHICESGMRNWSAETIWREMRASDLQE